MTLVSNAALPQRPEVKEAQSEIHNIIPRLLDSSNKHRISPLLLHALYKSATFEIDYQRTPPSIVRKDEFDRVKTTLQFLSERWRLAGLFLSLWAHPLLIHVGAYLQLLESAEATTFSP